MLRLPGSDAVLVREDLRLELDGGDALSFDLYLPPTAPGAPPPPAVVLVAGYPDDGMLRVLGCRFREMGSTRSWARLIAASGMAAIAYVNREPAADARALLRALYGGGASLGIDPARLGLWASSGNAPLALSLLMDTAPSELRCAALCYPYTLDLEGDTSVAEASRTFGFANPAAGRSVDDLPRQTPLLIARAGRDEMRGLNDGVDRFVAAALARNVPLELINHAEAPHAFDLFHDSAATREAIRQVLAFLRSHLVGEP